MILKLCCTNFTIRSLQISNRLFKEFTTQAYIRGLSHDFPDSSTFQTFQNQYSRIQALQNFSTTVRTKKKGKKKRQHGYKYPLFPIKLGS